MSGNYLSEEQVTRLLAPINPRRVAELDGLSHLEAYDVRAHLTRIFGFGRWGERIIDKTLLYALPTETRNKKEAVKVAYDVTVRLTIKAPDGTVLTEFDGAAVGESIMPTFKQGDAYDMALKTACSQALKRCAIDLGDQFGLSLYRNGSRDAIVMRTLVGATEETDAAPDEHAPPVVPEPQPEHDEGVDAPSGPTDGETVRRGPREQQAPYTSGDWVKAIEACGDLDCIRQLWREANAATIASIPVLLYDVDGIDIGDRIKARAEALEAQQTRPSQRKDPVVADAERQLEEAVAARASAAAPVNPLLESSPTPDDPRERRLTAARRGVLASLESLGVTEEQVAERFGRPVDQVATSRLIALVKHAITDQRARSEADAAQQPADDGPGPDLDVKPGKAREATLTALTEVFGNEEARDAAVEQIAGKPIALVGNRALSRILGEQTAGVPA